MMHWTHFRLILACGLLGHATVAHADDGVRGKAREHYRQGSRLFDERRLVDALEQFEKSYSLYPHFSILFNIGQVQVALGHPVQAVEAFERYLTQGGEAIPAEQKQQVETELKAQRQRIGDIKVTATPDGAEIRIDGVRVGKSPMTSAVKVAAGHHRVEAMLEGFRNEQREIDLLGLGYVELQFKLESLTPVVAQAAVPAPTPPNAPAQPAPSSTPPSPPPPVVNAQRTNERSPPLARTETTTSPSSASTSRPAAASKSPMSSGTTQRVFGYLSMAAGLVAGGVGTAFAIDGQSKHNTALNQWNADQKDQARATESDSQEEKTQGFVIIGAGGALALTGAILLVTAPSGPPSQGRLRFAPWIGVNTGGASVTGRW